MALEQVHGRTAGERMHETTVLDVVRLPVNVDIDHAALGAQTVDKPGQLIEVLIGREDVGKHVDHPGKVLLGGWALPGDFAPILSRPRNAPTKRPHTRPEEPAAARETPSGLRRSLAGANALERSTLAARLRVFGVAGPVR